VRWAYSNRAQLWAWLLSQWKTDPLMFLVIGVASATGLLVILIVAAYPRRVDQPRKSDQVPS